MLKIKTNNQTFEIPQSITELSWAQYKRLVESNATDTADIIAAICGITKQEVSNWNASEVNPIELIMAVSFILQGELSRLKEIPSQLFTSDFNIKARKFGEIILAIETLEKLQGDPIKSQEAIFGIFTGKTPSEIDDLPAYVVIFTSNFFLKKLQQFKGNLQRLPKFVQRIFTLLPSIARLWKN